MDFISNLAKGTQRTPFDPAIFEHPLALKTQWTPQAHGGTNFKTRTLNQVSPSELHYTGSSMAKRLVIFFGIFPLFFLIVGITMINNGGFQIEMLMFTIIPLVFVGVLIFMFKKLNTTIVFNKKTGYFFKGKKDRVSSLNPVEDKNTFKLAKIKALQIISERVRSKNSSFTSYEINFVFENGDRYNLIDHGKRNAIEQDAVTLANFLGVPVWNMVSETSYHPQQATQTDSYNSLEPHKTREKTAKRTYSSTFDQPSEANPNSLTQDLDAPYDSTKPRKM